MLWTIFVILLVLWLLGLVTSYTMGGFIHVLIVIAVVVLIIPLVQGRRVVGGLAGRWRRDNAASAIRGRGRTWPCRLPAGPRSHHGSE